MKEEDGWKEWSIYVLKELERLDGCVDKIDEDIEKIEEKITKSKISFCVFKKEMTLKASIWSLISGAVPVLILIAIYCLKHS